MAEVHVQVDVYCDVGSDEPVYRVYADNDLLTERTWIWPAYEVFIRENIIVNVEHGRHQIRIERAPNCSANFSVLKFVVNGEEKSSKDLTFFV